MTQPTDLPVIVIGAGPVGLAAAAHLIQRNLKPLVFEAGSEIADNVRSWQHVRMFSSWSYNVDAAARRLLEAQGWQAPDNDKLPTGRELLEQYLEPLAATPEIAEALHLGTRVVAVGRRGLDKVKTAGRADVPFRVVVRGPAGTRRVDARAVIDATGTWATPNPAGAGGVPADGEPHERMVYGIPDILDRDRERYADRRVLVVGSGHSAFNALLDLVAIKKSAPDTQIHWALRRDPATTYGGGSNDALPARGSLGRRLRRAVEKGIIEVSAPFEVEAVQTVDDGVLVRGVAGATITVDEIITATGSRPDLSFLREVRLDLDPALESTRALAPLIDPNVHSCGTVRPHGERELRQPEENFYIVGMKSYGRAPTFLLATGYEQVRSVVAALAGDRQAADQVELNLPETGVCSSEPAQTSPAETPASCCAPTAPAQTSCCGS